MNINFSSIGLGTWAWGDRMVWGYGNGYSEIDLHEAFETSMSAGITLIDTAEIYGSGKSEEFIGRFLRIKNTDAVIATKFLPFPWRVTKRSLRRALLRSLKRLQRESVELYQIHWPIPPVPIRLWMDAMADVVEDGLIKSVGVSNFSKAQMQRAQDRLAKRNIPLLSNQVEYSLLERKHEISGLLDECKSSGIEFIAYSPLAMGMLTGTYSPTSPPRGVRARRYGKKKLAVVEKLVALMREIGENYGGKTPAQVALNWTIRKGTIPIPGAKNAKQALQNAGAIGWTLSDDEMETLDRASVR